jgi:F-type H+-transporting ATPase subunit c
VNRIVQRVALTSVVLLTMAMPAMAQDEAKAPLIAFSGAFGAALTIIGAAFGIGKIGASAVESMARQPEVAGDIRGALLLAAALIEGATFFALIVCIIGGA